MPTRREAASRCCGGRRSSRKPLPAHMPVTIARRPPGLRRLIGNTPLLAIEYTWRGHPRTGSAKSEQLHLTGSIKDRMALHIIEEAVRDGRLAPGDTIVEATSANPGVSLPPAG